MMMERLRQQLLQGSWWIEETRLRKEMGFQTLLS